MELVDTTGVGGEARRPDDPLPRPVPVRARPVRRGAIARLAATALAVGLLVTSWGWLQRDGGPERALLFLYAFVAGVVAVSALVWAWKRHPY